MGDWFRASSAVSVTVGLLAVTVAVVLVVAAHRFGWISTSSTGASSTDSDAGSPADPSPSGEPVLDAEEAFVIDQLRSKGGRIQQSDIVEASDWSKSKVSRLLSRMEQDGLVEKVSVGRENVVVLTLDDP